MIALACYIATIFLANWAIETFGLVPVGFGLEGPAGVYFAGLAFTFRDLVQERLGRLWTIAAILFGAAASFLVAPGFAVASAAAFLVSELLDFAVYTLLASAAAFLVSESLDFAVYTPLRERNWIGAVAASNAVGLVADSALFLWLAFGSLDFLAGQVVGKAWMTLLAAAVLWRLRRRLGPKAARG